MASDGHDVNSAINGESYFVCFYEDRNPLVYLFKLIRPGWPAQTIAPDDVIAQLTSAVGTWALRLSMFAIQLLRFLNGPMEALGRAVELTGNTIVANGGLLKTLIRLLSSFFGFKGGPLIVPARESVDYRTLIGLLDPRTSLLVDVASPTGQADVPIFAGPDYGERRIADVLLLAAKVSYENEAIITKAVTESWKMNLVGVYDCWNEFQQRRNKQVFVFKDKEDDASAVVVAWRGTEAFSAYDWSTDIDFSWYDLQGGMGRVHLGFLEALGLGDRTKMDTFTQVRKNSILRKQRDFADRNPLTTAASGLSPTVVGDPDKILAYDHVTKVLKELLDENPNAKIFLTGHSLGGALAILYSGMLYYFGEDKLADRIAAIYTFGQPRVGDVNYCNFMVEKVGVKRFYRVVYSNDVVPRLPFDDVVFNFKHWGLCYYFNSLTYREQTLEEMPNKNYFAVGAVVSMYVAGVWEIISTFIRVQRYGPEYRESTASILFRVVTLIFPGLGDHSPVNYMNSVRLGSPWPLP